MQDALRDNRLPLLAAGTMIVGGIAIRLIGLPFLSFDMQDWLLHWYEKLATEGFSAFREPFSNYTPPYLYLLALATTTGGFLPPVTAIKLISIAFDLCNAAMVYKILKLRYPQGQTALLGASGFLLLPTIILNSAYWGQADSVFTFFTLACLYFLLKDRPLAALILFGVAFAFKAQSAFLAPLLLLLTLRRKIPWQYFGVIPIVYGVLMIPAAVAGRPFGELLTIYAMQTGQYGGLSMHAPTLYVFVPDAWYTQALVGGFVLTFLVVIAWLSIYVRDRRSFDHGTVILSALASVAILPFFLPKMHDRYFYLADVLSFLVAFYFPRLWYLALGYQIVSGLAYSMFLLPSAITIKRRVGEVIFQAVIRSAALINALITGLLLWHQYVIRHHAINPGTIPSGNTAQGRADA